MSFENIKKPHVIIKGKNKIKVKFQAKEAHDKYL